MPSGCGGGVKFNLKLRLNLLLFTHHNDVSFFKLHSGNGILLCRACFEAGVPEGKFIQQLFPV